MGIYKSRKRPQQKKARLKARMRGRDAAGATRFDGGSAGKVMRRGPERRTRKGKNMAEIASRYEQQVPTCVEKKRGKGSEE
jgi:hypothetical protein